MKLAIAICTTRQLMQFIPTLKPESVNDPDIASKIAGFALDKIVGVCSPDEKFHNAMVTAIDAADQPFANEVRDWIYKHLGAESTQVLPVDVEVQ